MKPNKEVPPAPRPNLGAPLRVSALRRLSDAAQAAGQTTTNLIVLQPKCHPGAPTIATYWADCGALLIECCECREPVCQIAVGR